MNNKLLQRTKQLVAWAALGGLISVVTPAAMAAQISINLGGSYNSNPFSATISYDSDLALEAWDDGIYGPVEGVTNLGSITFNYNGSSHTSDISGILITKNAIINDLFSSSISFLAGDYSFVIEGFSSSTAFNWSENLLPNEANPYPFGAQGENPITLFFHVPGHTTVESYEVTSAVPVPATAWLLGSGLIGLGSLARRRRAA